MREAASLPSDQALKMNVIDLVADNLPQLLDQLNGRAVTHGRRSRAPSR